MSNDNLKTVASISALFDLMTPTKTEDERLKKVNQKKRFFETIPGIQFPDDWDDLPLEEKEKRIKKAQDCGLGKDI